MLEIYESMNYTCNMNHIQELNEYFDELYPITEELKQFYDTLIKNYDSPAKLLRIGCGTGHFEHYLAQQGHDVTGIEDFQEMLESANRRRRFPNMAIRYFYMTSLEMSRFLGKGFYDIITCKDNKIIFIHDSILMRKFFYDCKNLLSPGGKLILHLDNFDHYKPAPMAKLATIESMRAKLFTQLWEKEEDLVTLDMDLECSTGKILSILKNVKVTPLTPDKISEISKEAGFTSINFYENFLLGPLEKDSTTVVAVLS